MIHVFFVPGMFGSTIEYLLRNYTKEYENVTGDILLDGSMHSFKKEYHPNQVCSLDNIKLTDNSIATPIYPFPDIHLDDLLKKYHVNDSKDQCAIVYAKDLAAAELNCLFQYHKVAFGARVKSGLDIFCSSNNVDAAAWNVSYQSWQDMQTWELREWFSIFYPSWTLEWITSPNLIPKHWMTISNTDLLDRTLLTFKTIIEFFKLTEDVGVDKFAVRWRTAQQYIIDEFHLLASIVDHVVQQKEFGWLPINIIAEAIVQQRLRAAGYEIRCNGLNTFPTDAKTLYNLLESV